MIELTLAEVALAVNGQIYRGEPSAIVSGLSSTDSREILSGIFSLPSLERTTTVIAF
ncbi:hypothetical protein [Aquiluna sp. Uisw_065]|uniref:hypothetical protein n=1 Tax=Aquiluna sp. Uisw_065 TaxID=3230967 RepID=UPI0039E9EC3F